MFPSDRFRWMTLRSKVIWLQPVFELVAAKCHWHLAQTVEKVQPMCWAFSILYDIIIMGHEKCLNEEKWSEAFMKL